MTYLTFCAIYINTKGNCSHGSPVVSNTPSTRRKQRPSITRFCEKEKGEKTMDREQDEIQFLGFFGIFKEAFTIIFCWRKIFSQITLALILPLSLVFLAHIQISQLLFYHILNNESTLHKTQVGTPSYAKLSDIISSEWTAFWLFKIAYFTFVLILSLLSTSAAVYTIACAYTAKPVTFKKVLSVVPKVWKRLVITFIWGFAVVFVYNVIAAFVLVLWGKLLAGGTVALVVLVVVLLIYAVGLLYITIVWHLASVVSVLEDTYGVKAMVKSKKLIKGKMGVAASVFIVLGTCFAAVEFLIERFAVFGGERSVNMGIKIGIGILCLLLLLKIFLIGLVIQTILYFVCKSYHHEDIDKSSLADHLEVYTGDYVPLKSRDIQMEQFQV